MRTFVFLLFCTFFLAGFTQGLTGVSVETYYISDASDAKHGDIEEGLTTYRVFIELAEGYSLQAVYGSPEHPLTIASSEAFYNNSNVTIGAACMDRLGVFKADDSDGSSLGQKKKTGLCNQTKDIGLRINASDGLVHGKAKSLTTFGIDLSSLETEANTSTITASNGAWAALGGFSPESTNNKVLIAQLTTTGQLSFEINLQLGTPDGQSQRYVARNPQPNEQLFETLVYPLRNTGLD